MPASDPPIVPAPKKSRSRVPAGLMGMLALIVGVEATIVRHDYDLTTLVASNWQIEGKAPARHASKHPILCFGDSMVKFGVQPRILGGILGKSAYNFALYCGAPHTSYYMLERSIAAGAKPAAIVVDFQPELLMGDAMRITSRTFPELLTFRELADLCWLARRWNSPDPGTTGPVPLASDRFAEFVVARCLPSARKRYEIRAAVLAAIEGKSVSVKEKLLAAKRNWKLNNGAEVLPKNPYYGGEVPEFGAYPAMFWMPWKPNPLAVVYLERFLALAESKHVPVFWLLQANANEVDVRREKVGYNAMVEEFIRHYQDVHPNLIVVDGRHVNYPHQYFTDPVHLDRDGGAAFSFGVAEVMKTCLGGNSGPKRWFDLPDHRNRSAELPLEDNAQSGLALKAEEAVRR